ncbi:hypothetical protein BCAL_3002 [Bifidobacterium callitrichos DSM 23973]|uniref:Uncharacterized protein n=1 Tax=Bifidobacterium callitrichos DSM 23973 TaxID=1437609 RepID=A0A087A8V7_9BIFI|nr:hypothetical protein BCAL_3002 [Bifidobacterium callitrichos DSM 23973]
MAVFQRFRNGRYRKDRPCRRCVCRSTRKTTEIALSGTVFCRSTNINRLTCTEWQPHRDSSRIHPRFTLIDVSAPTESNVVATSHHPLNAGSYRIGRSVCSIESGPYGRAERLRSRPEGAANSTTNFQRRILGRHRCWLTYRAYLL